MNIKLKSALEFLKMGIAVIPLRHRGKEPDLIPTWERYKTELPTQYDVINWLGSTWQNYGVVMGWKNLAVLDFDNMDAFTMWLDYYARYLGRVYETIPYIVRTARGAHVYLSMPGGGNNQKRRGVDVKYHGYVVGPVSIHPSGTIYQPINNFHLMDVFSLDTILPPELFPPVAPQMCLPIAPVTMQQQIHTEYDVFDMVSNSSTFDLIAKIKSSVRIESMFANVQKSSADGRWLKCLCPFHDDKNPSMWIDTARQICGCASCNFKPMDVINLYARSHGIDEPIAVIEMAREIGIIG